MLNDVRVLVVEDDPALLGSIESALQERHRVTACRSPQSALAMVEAGKHFDVLVCGYEMREMNGRELRARLAERDPVLAHNSLLLGHGRLSIDDEELLEDAHARVLYHPLRSERLRDEVHALAARAALAAGE